MQPNQLSHVPTTTSHLMLVYSDFVHLLTSVIRMNVCIVRTCAGDCSYIMTDVDMTSTVQILFKLQKNLYKTGTEALHWVVGFFFHHFHLSDYI